MPQISSRRPRPEAGGMRRVDLSVDMSAPMKLAGYVDARCQIAKLGPSAPKNMFLNNHQDIEMDKNCSSFSTLNLTAHSVTRLRRAQSPFEGHRQSFPGEHRQPVDPLEPDSQWCF